MLSLPRQGARCRSSALLVLFVGALRDGAGTRRRCTRAYCRLSSSQRTKRSPLVDPAAYCAICRGDTSVVASSPSLQMDMSESDETDMAAAGVMADALGSVGGSSSL
jgi:hypothetical protein